MFCRNVRKQTVIEVDYSTNQRQWNKILGWYYHVSLSEKLCSVLLHSRTG